MREPADADRLLIDTARAALFEITDEETVGAVVGLIDDQEGVVDVLFASTMSGYPGWRWNVSVSTADGPGSLSVLEAELLPGDGALLAPDWVPWADRLAEYRAAQAEAAAVEGDDDDDLDEDESDLLDPDDDEIDGVDFEDAADESEEAGYVEDASADDEAEQTED